MRKAGTGSRAHLNIPEAPPQKRKRVSAARGAGKLHRPLGALIGGYAGQDPKARLHERRPKRFDGMAALEAADQH